MKIVNEDDCVGIFLLLARNELEGVEFLRNIVTGTKNSGISWTWKQETVEVDGILSQSFTATKKFMKLACCWKSHGHAFGTLVLLRSWNSSLMPLRLTLRRTPIDSKSLCWHETDFRLLIRRGATLKYTNSFTASPPWLYCLRSLCCNSILLLVVQYFLSCDEGKKFFRNNSNNSIVTDSRK